MNERLEKEIAKKWLALTIEHETKERVIIGYRAMTEIAQHFYNIALEDAEKEIVKNFKVGQLSPLPSNLDKAAEEWSKRNNRGIALCADKKSHYLAEGMDAFKAGAEWMAGQGETRDDIVVMENFNDKAHIFPIPSSEFNPGDRVVVQIRKK